MQLDLFADAPRHYHVALERLAELDFSGCRGALCAHRRDFDRGPDPRPVEEAASWLEERVPHARSEPRVSGCQALELCRALMEGRASAAFPRLGSKIARKTARTVAKHALRTMADAGIDPAVPLDAGLPWGVFRLWAGDLAGARSALERFLRKQGPSPRAYLALGDALWGAGRHHEARCAYRDGYGQDPDGGGWHSVCPRIWELKRTAETDPAFSGPWWMVGAYLDGDFFPRCRGASPDEVHGRQKQFTLLLEARRAGGGADPGIFYAALFLSENGSWLDSQDLAVVRKTLRELHPEAYEAHMDQLAAE